MSDVTKGILLDSGKKFFTELLAGSHSNNKFGMYIEYYNGNPSAPALLATRQFSYYEDLSSPAGYVRVPFVSTAAVSTATGSGTEYNTVFTGSVLNGYYTHGAGLEQGSSKFYSATLVYMDSPTDRTKDVPVFVRNFYAGNNFTPVIYAANTNFTATINLILG